MNGEWLVRGRDGRLSMYLMTQDAVLCRAELVPGGPWDTPRRLGGDRRLHSAAAVGQGADRYAHLVAWSATASGVQELVHSTHFRPLLAALDWDPVGRPEDGEAATGVPGVAVDDQGRAHIFVRDSGGGLRMRAQAQKGGWGPWRDLKGAGVREAPVAVPGRAGRIEVYAAGEGTILYWRQEAPATKFELVEVVEAEVRPDTLRALASSDENTTLFFTDASGHLAAWRPGGRPISLMPAAGPGPVSAVRCVIDGHDCTVVAQRSTAGGRVAFAAYPSELEEMGAAWTESGPALPNDATVSLALDADGRLVAATLSPATGQLRITRRKDEAGLALGAWREV
ncbi:hypothetical protein [Streptomyces sp. DZ1-3]|uniref:hypothetical protein n=1 Tax=Streptomyces sp. DZ1-3 TaxID=3417466 RepID=UPI003CE957F8